MRIIPINKTLKAGVTDPAQLSALLTTWLGLNNMRWVVMTIMWMDLIYYFIAKGDLVSKLSGNG
jgi:hypothetical protein